MRAQQVISIYCFSQTKIYCTQKYLNYIHFKEKNHFFHVSLKLLKKALIITYYWPPSGGAGVQRMLKFVKYMPAFNVEPFVLTIHEDNAFYPLLDKSLLKDISPNLKLVKTKNTEILKVFSSLLKKKEMPHSGFANHNKNTVASKLLRFLRGNLLIPDARRTWVNPAFKAACQLIEENKIDTVIISSPPHSSQLIGLKLKEKYPHIKWIADLRDPWTDIYYYKDLLHTSWAKKLDLKYEQEVMKKANSVLVVSDGIKESLSEKYADLATKIDVISNGFDEDDFLIPSQAPQHEFLITHTGTIADSYNPEMFFSALQKLISKYGTQCKIRILFVGKTFPTLKKLVEKHGLIQNVSYQEYVPHEEVVRIMKNTTCLFLIIAETTNQKGLLSGKLFEYLGAKKPIIAIGPKNGDAEDIINLCEAGKIFSRDQEKEMVDFLSEKVEDWLKNPNLDLAGGKIDVYSRKNLTSRLCKIITN